MPADSFVGIWKFIARPNLCETPALAKPPPRWLQCAGDSAYFKQKGQSVADNNETADKKIICKLARFDNEYSHESSNFATENTNKE